MKNAALFLIAFCIACVGYLYSKRLELRVKKIEKILIFLSQVKTEIEFTAESVDGILKSVSENLDVSLLPFIADSIKIMGDGEDFFTAWSRALEKKENIYSLKKEDIAALVSFGASFGRTDASGQIRNCEVHERLFKEKLDDAVSGRNTLSRPARGIGLLTGAAVLILFM